ncbi:hypothetical protein H5T87_10450 [bacterium]|nr:hypothetical protein [bacterium]
MKASKFLWTVFVFSFVLIGGVLGNEFFQFYSQLPVVSEVLKDSQSSLLALQAATIIVFLFVFFYLASSGFRWLIEFGEELQKMSFEDKFAIVVGILLGLILTLIVAPILWHVPRLGVALSILSATFFVYLGIVASLSVKKELPGLVFSRMTKEIPSSILASPKIIDTSVIIDGRIKDVLKSGFVEGQIVIPSFIIEELQTISDSDDPLKRMRGRRGFEMLNELRKEMGERIVVVDDPEIPRFEPMDSKLVRLAKKMKGKIITNDTNLSSIANLQGVETLSINELAVALKPIIHPGESMTVALVKEGKEPDQAVGYLDDGTMVVVDNARQFIGQTIEVEVVSILQTAGGKMIFATPKESATKVPRKPPTKK